MRFVTEKEAKKIIESRPTYSGYSSFKKTTYSDVEEDFIFVTIYMKFKKENADKYQFEQFGELVIDEFCYIQKR